MSTKDEAISKKDEALSVPDTLKLALEAMNLARAAHGQMLLSDPPQEAWKAWGVNAALTKAMTAIREALMSFQDGAQSRSDVEQPAQRCKYGNEPVSCTSSPMDCQCALDAVFEQPAQQEQGDSNCQDDDGCPTEIAVLQRFWRGEPIPTEHYPAWFRPAQQQERAMKVEGPLHVVCQCDRCKAQELVSWRNAALRVGEDLCSVGPFGYYDMTAEQWLDWALSVVTVHAPPTAQQQEPVAWITQNGKGWLRWHKPEDMEKNNG